MQLSVPIVSPIRAHGAVFRAFYLAFHADEGLTRSALVRKLGREAEPHIEAFEAVGASAPISVIQRTIVPRAALLSVDFWTGLPLRRLLENTQVTMGI